MYEMCYNPLYYPRLLKEKEGFTSKYTKQIDKDLHRTFPDDQFFKSGESFNILKRILTAYSLRNPSVGYCQGMNFIAGRFLTLGFSELEAFWLLVQVIEKYLPFEYFSTMTGVVQDQKIFDFLLRTRIPKVARAFDELGINSSLLTVQWFICLYAYTFSKDVVARIWDEIFLFGYTVIYKFSLAVFWIHQKEIIREKDFTKIFDSIETQCKQILDPKQFFDIANKRQFRIKYMLLAKLKEIAEKEVQLEANERINHILSEKEILDKIYCRCQNEDECKQKNLFTSGYFTFVDENGICIEEDYFENQDYDRIVNVSLVRDSGSIIVGQKNHVCKIDVEEEDNERTIPYAVRSSFLVMDDEIRNLDYD